MITRLVAAFVLCASVAQTQQIIIETLDGPEINGLENGLGIETLRPGFGFDLGDAETIEEVRAVAGTGALLRGLDKLNGDVVDIEMQNGFSVGFGSLRVDLAECRHPDDNATGEAYAFLTIYDGDQAVDPLFQGWMIASSPALSAMDHARYDIWVLRCMTAEASGNE